MSRRVLVCALCALILTTSASAAGSWAQPQIALVTAKGLMGGFDCSGFIWRVYKRQSYAGTGALAATLKGRTTFAMSGEVPRAKRIPLADLEPGDLLFFGAHGPQSKPA